jgi:hypothetical protein
MPRTYSSTDTIAPNFPTVEIFAVSEQYIPADQLPYFVSADDCGVKTWTTSIAKSKLRPRLLGKGVFAGVRQGR